MAFPVRTLDVYNSPDYSSYGSVEMGSWPCFLSYNDEGNSITSWEGGTSFTKRKPKFTVHPFHELVTEEDPGVRRKTVTRA